jgi:hypothetical protein
MKPLEPKIVGRIPQKSEAQLQFVAADLASGAQPSLSTLVVRGSPSGLSGIATQGMDIDVFDGLTWHLCSRFMRLGHARLSAQLRSSGGAIVGATKAGRVHQSFQQHGRSPYQLSERHRGPDGVAAHGR